MSLKDETRDEGQHFQSHRYAFYYGCLFIVDLPYEPYDYKRDILLNGMILSGTHCISYHAIILFACYEYPMMTQVFTIR